jgi:glucosylceramidase
MSGPAARSLDGIAYHCYFGDPGSMSTFHAAYPHEDVIEDECSTGISVLSPIQVLIRSVSNWASTVLMWNLALDPSGGPKIGSGCFNCIGVVTVDPKTGKVKPTGNFYELGQASEFVHRGARRIGTSIAPAPPDCANDPVCGVEAAAFRNPDGSFALVIANSGPATTIAVRRPDGSGFTYSLPQQQPPNGTDNSRDEGVATFIWR